MSSPDSKNTRKEFDPTATVVEDVHFSPHRQILPDESKGLIQVEVVGGPMDGLVAKVSRTYLTIGRGEMHDISLPLDLMVSSSHACIVREGDHYWLEDLGSRNGTYIGDERIVKRTLIGPGTIFVVGRTCLEFMPHRGV